MASSDGSSGLWPVKGVGVENFSANLRPTFKWINLDHSFPLGACFLWPIFGGW